MAAGNRHVADSGAVTGAALAVIPTHGDDSGEDADGDKRGHEGAGEHERDEEHEEHDGRPDEHGGDEEPPAGDEGAASA